jgi:hypothetical protein
MPERRKAWLLPAAHAHAEDDGGLPMKLTNLAEFLGHCAGAVFIPVLAAALGALSGQIVSLLQLGDAIRGTLQTTLAMWEIGATLGFIAGFIRLAGYRTRGTNG